MFSIGVIIVLVLWLIKRPFSKSNYNFRAGQAGEMKVIKQLNNLPADFVVENNVKIKGSQIDHLVFYKEHIFVIETKNWNGNLQGSPNNKYLTKYSVNSVSKVYNPIFQNRTHCRAVKRKYPHASVHNIVVFVNALPDVFHSCRSVISLSDLLPTLMRFVSV